MAAGSRPWQTPGHVSPKILENLVVSKWQRACDWLIYGHVICCLPRSSPGRHFECREEAGDEVVASPLPLFVFCDSGCRVERYPLFVTTRPSAGSVSEK